MHPIQCFLTHLTAVLLFLCSLISLSHADTYIANQGDVLRINIPASLPKAAVEVQAFEKKWPIFKRHEETKAWIAIHLNTKPGNYRLIWKSNGISLEEQITVSKGNFRISHIHVEEKMARFDEASLKRIRADQQSIALAYQQSVPIMPSWPEMRMPVDGEISTPFAAQRYINGNARSPHSGIDIAAPTGTPVHAPLDGIVLLVSDMYLNGNLVVIGHGSGITSVYAHLHQVLVKVGDHVNQEDIFAEVGSTGRSTGPHLHWGVHFLGAKINPASMLPQTDLH